MITLLRRSSDGSGDEAPGFADQLDAVLSTSTPLPPAWLGVTLGVVAFVVAITSTWARVLGALEVFAHEFGHALAAIVSGGGVHLIRLDGHDHGVTYAWHYGAFSAGVTAFFGYPAPGLAGWGLAYLVSAGKAAPALAVLVVITFLVLFVARGMLTVVVTVGLLVVSAATLWWASPWAQAVLVTALAWLLLIGGLVHLLALTRDRYIYGGDGPSDADAVAVEWFGPALLWIVAWIGISGWCVWASAPLLVAG